MHLIAEQGIAAHWKYKEKGGVDALTEKKFNWLRELVEWHRQMRNPGEFLETVKNDLFDVEIYVFTPKGEVKELPEGATPLDFAYSIHTDVGNKTVGAKVNGKIVQLKHQLRNGDTIEILTSPTQTPHKDWLKSCITSRAQNKIRAFITTEERKRATQIGQELLEKELRKVGIAVERMKKSTEYEKFMREVGAQDTPDVFLQVGYGKLIPAKIIERLFPEAKPSAPEEPPKETFLSKVFKEAKKKRKEPTIRVSGDTDILVRYARCCNPIPGDPIVGFISRGRGVTIHQASCKKTFEIDGARQIDVEWTGTGQQSFRHIKIKVISQDAPGLLKAMSETFTNNGINIANAQIRTTKDNRGVCIFDVEVRDIKQVEKVIADLQKIKGIVDAERINYS
jgi:GTP pyrophosphokinase